MSIQLFDDHLRHKFLPLAFTRPVGLLRVGIRTIAEKWNDFDLEVGNFKIPDFLSPKFNPIYQNANVYVNSRLIPEENIVMAIRSLAQESALTYHGSCVAFKTKSEFNFDQIAQVHRELTQTEYSGTCFLLERISDLFTHNEKFIQDDFDKITAGRRSAEIESYVNLIGPADRLFIEPGAQILPCSINTTSGPVYIGKDAEVMEGCMIRGPFALCKKATLKMGAKIYGATTIGPYSKVGGEVGNSVLLGYSNKGHDGYLGNSVLGEWCNLGADTNTSNLKNNYSEVKTWDYKEQKLVNSGQTFIGLIMGDHSKSAINTQFNTGTTVGCCANIFGGGFPPKFIPSFSWGGSDGFEPFELEKSYDVAERVMVRRGIDFTSEDRDIFRHIRDESASSKE
jgi:UDP-N-acetylglucosamine diphosphorylase/glucosamine-1-phosphate N-acetyltransferase